MNNGLYHIQNNKIYKMSLDEPMKKIGVVANDEAIMNIIDTVTEYTVSYTHLTLPTIRLV